MENWLAQLGAGTKHLTERVAEYPSAVHDQQLYYAYEPSSPAHGHGASSKHHYGGGGHKGNAALSALTLLAFLFFLHILQQCLKEHMTAMTNPQVMVVSAGRQGDRLVAKTSDSSKLDKAGLVRGAAPQSRHGEKFNDKMDSEDSAPSSTTDSEVILTRIATAEHTPKEGHEYRIKQVNHSTRSSIFDGFVTAMD